MVNRTPGPDKPGQAPRPHAENARTTGTSTRPHANTPPHTATGPPPHTDQNTAARPRAGASASADRPGTGHQSTSAEATTHTCPDTNTDVLTSGETMIALRGTGPLKLGDTMDVSTAGTESNVAIGLARLGHAVRWAGIVGDG